MRSGGVAAGLAVRFLRAVLAASLLLSSWALFTKDATPASTSSSQIGEMVARADKALEEAKAAGVDYPELLDLQRIRLKAAQGLVNQMGQDDGSALDQGVDLARKASLAQGQQLGIDLPKRLIHHAPASQAEAVAPISGSPSENLREFAARHQVKLSARQKAAIESLDDLPYDLRQALAEVLDSYSAFEAAAKTTLPAFISRGAARGATGQGSGQTENEMSGANKDLGPLFSSRADLLDATKGLGNVLENKAAAQPEIERVEVPGLFSIDLTSNSSTYTDDFALSVDAGGNDTYHNNAGGRHKLASTPTSCIDLRTEATSRDPSRISRIVTADALLDFGGNDDYGNRDNLRHCGVNGGGFLGTGFLVDAAGDDVYEAGGASPTQKLNESIEGGNNGGARLGVGFLLDAQGRDWYSGHNGGVNGGAFAGIGFLGDMGQPSEATAKDANDVYVGGTGGANGGAVGQSPGISGDGLLVDAGGDDHYEAKEGGVNGGASGFSSGMLVDGKGNDVYLVKVDATICSPRCGGVNGGSVERSGGFLLDAAGDDFYGQPRASVGGPGGPNGANGGAMFGAAMLLDAGGDDDYLGGNQAINGGSSLGTGMLVDATGNDCYETLGDTGTNGGVAPGFLFPVGDAPGTALLFDAGGFDTYTENGSTTNNNDNGREPVRVKGQFGAQIDLPPVPEGTAVNTAPCAAGTTTTSITRRTTTTTVDPSTTTTTLLPPTTTTLPSAPPTTILAPTTTTTLSPPASPTTTVPDLPRQPGSEDPPWVEEPLGHLQSPGFLAAMAYDEKRQNIVLLRTVGPTSETWTWNGLNWSKQFPLTSPPTRFGAAMAYHPKTEKVVLFGGKDEKDVAMSDTWAWDGSTWQAKNSEPSPPPRFSAGLSQDGAEKLVLFGGAGSSFLGDTWTWDGFKWEERKGLTRSPLPRTARMAFDASRQQVVLFGGQGLNGFYGDTWVWEGSSWDEKKGLADSPPARGAPAIAFHQGSRQTVLFGGFGASIFNDTWTWDGTKWVRRTPEESPRSSSSQLMAYHGPSAKAVFTNGETAEPTWTWAPRSGPVVPHGGLEISSKLTVALEPDTIPADGVHRSTATATLKVGGRPSPAQRLWFDTEGDVSFEPPGPAMTAPYCITNADGKCSIAVRASKTAGVEVIEVRWEVGAQGSAKAHLTEEPVEALPPCHGMSVVEPGPEGWWGNLDPTFGPCGGRVLTKSGTNAHALDTVVQRDGKAVVVTWLDYTDYYPGKEMNSWMFRYLPNGRLDPEFGKAGAIKVPLSWGGLALQDDQKIIALTGSLSRYNPDGSLDDGGPEDSTPGDSFGVGGRSSVGGHRMAVQPDGRILATSWTQDPGNANRYRVAVVRANADGTPDDGGPTDSTRGDFFGTNGRVVFAYNDHHGSSEPGSIAVQEDGRIVVGGHWTAVENGLAQFALRGQRHYAMARLLPNGDLDKTFNPCPSPNGLCDGRFVASAEGSSTVRDIAIQRDEKILAAGEGDSGILLVRFNKNGTIDKDFAGCGPAACGGKDQKLEGDAFAVDILKDDKIMIAGGADGQFLLGRFNPDGTLDDGCGMPPSVKTSFISGGAAFAMAIEDDGNVIAAGRHETNEGLTTALARYQGGGVVTAPSTVEVQGATVNEPAAGKTESPFNVKLRLDAPACQPIKLNYATKDGSATAGQDYVGSQGSVMFQKGEQEKTVPVPVLSDDVSEPPETFSLEVSNPLKISDLTKPKTLTLPIKLAEGQATILDKTPAGPEGKQPAPDVPGISISDASVVEGNYGVTKADFTVALNRPSKQIVSVRYATFDQTAVSPDDYVGESATVTFEPGQTKKTIEVGVKADAQPEQTESFLVALSDPKGVGLLRDKATATIYDDDVDIEPNVSSRPSRLPAAAAALLVPGANLPPPSLAQGTQIQAQQQIQQQLQQQIQAQVMAGAMMERQRQAEVEKAGLSDKDLYLASARRTTSPAWAVALAWLGALAAFGAALHGSRSRAGEAATVKAKR